MRRWRSEMRGSTRAWPARRASCGPPSVGRPELHGDPVRVGKGRVAHGTEYLVDDLGVALVRPRSVTTLLLAPVRRVVTVHVYALFLTGSSSALLIGHPFLT